MRKTGIIRSWNDKRGFGVIRVGDASSLEKYFLHISGIRSGTATPTAGMSVEFEVRPIAVREDQLPQAYRADIILTCSQSIGTDGGAA